MTKLKIWGRNNSMNVQKTMWGVAEVGVDYERIDAGLQYGIVDEPSLCKDVQKRCSRF